MGSAEELNIMFVDYIVPIANLIANMLYIPVIWGFLVC